MKRKPDPLPDPVEPLSPGRAWSWRNAKHLGRRRERALEDAGRWWRLLDNATQRRADGPRGTDRETDA